MKKTKYFCDICKKELLSDKDLYYLKQSPKWARIIDQRIDMEVCTKCAKKIKDYIDLIKNE